MWMLSVGSCGFNCAFSDSTLQACLGPAASTQPRSSTNAATASQYLPKKKKKKKKKDAFAVLVCQTSKPLMQLSSASLHLLSAEMQSTVLVAWCYLVPALELS